MRGKTLQRSCFALRWGHHRGRVAGEATDAGVTGIGAKQLLATLGAAGERNRLGGIQEAHEDREHQPVRKFVQRIVERLVSNVSRIIAEDVVRFVLIKVTIWTFIDLLREQIIGHAHFHVVSFAGKDRD